MECMKHMLIAVLKPWPFRNGQVKVMAVSKPFSGFRLAWPF